MVEFKQTLRTEKERVLESSGSLSGFPNKPLTGGAVRKVPGGTKKVRIVSGSIRGWGIH